MSNIGDYSNKETKGIFESTKQHIENGLDQFLTIEEKIARIQNEIENTEITLEVMKQIQTDLEIEKMKKELGEEK